GNQIGIVLPVGRCADKGSAPKSRDNRFSKSNGSIIVAPKQYKWHWPPPAPPDGRTICCHWQGSPPHVPSPRPWKHLHHRRSWPGYSPMLPSIGQAPPCSCHGPRNFFRPPLRRSICCPQWFRLRYGGGGWN